jgi:hypothetical protein
VAGETCATCGTARKGSFRYCFSCGHDYEPRSGTEEASQWPSRGARAGVLSQAVPTTPSEEPIPDHVACPYLGLADDADTHFMFATPGHRCRAEREPARISLPHQGQYCLSSDYPTCPIYPVAERAAGSYRRPGSAHTSSTRSGPWRRRSFGPFVLAALLFVAAVWVIGTRGQEPSSGDGARVVMPSQSEASDLPSAEAS